MSEAFPYRPSLPGASERKARPLRPEEIKRAATSLEALGMSDEELEQAIKEREEKFNTYRTQLAGLNYQAISLSEPVVRQIHALLQSGTLEPAMKKKIEQIAHGPRYVSGFQFTGTLALRKEFDEDDNAALDYLKQQGVITDELLQQGDEIFRETREIQEKLGTAQNESDIDLFLAERKKRDSTH